MKTEIIQAVKTLLKEWYTVDSKLIGEVFDHIENQKVADKEKRQDVVAWAITTFLAQQVEEKDLWSYTIREFLSWIKK